MEALAQFNPFTAALAHLYGYTHASDFEKDLERFWTEIAAKIGDHEGRLAYLEARLEPGVSVSNQAFEVLSWLLQTNTSGLSDLVEFEHVRAAFPDVQKTAVEEALAELRYLGYIKTDGALGQAVFLVRLQPVAFVAFDLVATENDTRADAVAIAALWLEEPHLRLVPKLCEHLGWERRRLNPAVSALLEILPDGCPSKEIQNRFATISVTITETERFMLRRIVSSKRID